MVASLKLIHSYLSASVQEIHFWSKYYVRVWTSHCPLLARIADGLSCVSVGLLRRCNEQLGSRPCEGTEVTLVPWSKVARVTFWLSDLNVWDKRTSMRTTGNKRREVLSRVIREDVVSHFPPWFHAARSGCDSCPCCLSWHIRGRKGQLPFNGTSVCLKYRFKSRLLFNQRRLYYS